MKERIYELCSEYFFWLSEEENQKEFDTLVASIEQKLKGQAIDSGSLIQLIAQEVGE